MGTAGNTSTPAKYKGYAPANQDRAKAYAAVIYAETKLRWPGSVVRDRVFRNTRIPDPGSRIPVYRSTGLSNLLL